ncbi:hypothetical protein BY458DRAFT_514115 [Sporodiniella umbellata]|nr:hypothetical protein BY458DRAFT_514115 [Sporodiniella umbellata]
MNHFKTSSVSEVTLVNHESLDTLNQLLRKLDKGTEATMNLHALLTTKTAELNELVQQLKTIDRVLADVENGTEQIERVLKDSQVGHLVYAEATLDSALESACTLCGTSNKSDKEKEEEETTKVAVMNQLNIKLKRLGINPTHYYCKSDDVAVLQKSVIDLEIAKTMSTLIKEDYKRRHALMKNKGHHEQTKQLEEKIREELKLWYTYTRNATFYVQGKNIVTLLEHSDHKQTPPQLKHSASAPKFSTPSSTRPGSVSKLRRILSKQSTAWFKAAKSVI